MSSAKRVSSTAPGETGSTVNSGQNKRNDSLQKILNEYMTLKRNPEQNDEERKQAAELFLQSYIENRVFEQMKYYSSNSRKNKKMYTRCTIVTIILSGSIPVITTLSSCFTQTAPSWTEVIVAVFSAAVSIINAVLSLYNSRDLWISYRNTRERLIHVLNSFYFGVAPFNKPTQEEKDILLIKTCEKEMEMENGSWRSSTEK